MSTDDLLTAMLSGAIPVAIPNGALFRYLCTYIHVLECYVRLIAAKWWPTVSVSLSAWQEI